MSRGICSTAQSTGRAGARARTLSRAGSAVDSCIRTTITAWRLTEVAVRDYLLPARQNSKLCKQAASDGIATAEMSVCPSYSGGISQESPAVADKPARRC